ncbi:hypothetical protein IWX78_001715 [Mycetocola sp. CAN_C7]|uniref:hypothetical protein n=1 Tax=Mycetocola sp. CAN_C7 TaxID=2787724 RepID=UPI0018C9AA43
MTMDSPRMIRAWQVAFIALGVLLLGLGGLVLLDVVKPERYPGILLWLGGAIILHDLIIAPLVFGVGLLMRRASKRIPLGVLMIVQGAILVGAVTSLIVLPQVLGKERVSARNETVLPLDYAGNLVLFYVVLAALTALAIVVYLRVLAKRQNTRPSRSQT